MTLLEKYKEEYQAGIEEGRMEGRMKGLAEGANRKLIQQICRKLRKGKTPAQIAEELEEDEIRVKVICDMAEEYAPLYDEEKVTEAVLAQV